MGSGRRWLGLGNGDRIGCDLAEGFLSGEGGDEVLLGGGVGSGVEVDVGVLDGGFCTELVHFVDDDFEGVGEGVWADFGDLVSELIDDFVGESGEAVAEA